MTTVREQAIEAGARALGDLFEDEPINYFGTAAAVVDAVEPIIEAEVRERIAQEIEVERDKWIATKEPWRAERVHGLNTAAAIARGAS